MEKVMQSDTITYFPYTLPSGAQIEIEGIEEKKIGGQSAIARSMIPGSMPFEQVVAPLGEIADLLFTKIKSAVNVPDTITLEFGASIKGQTKLLIMSGEGQGNVKVTLTWNRKKE